MKLLTPRMRFALAALAALVASAHSAGTAFALDPQRARGLADQISVDWRKQQNADGFFRDTLLKAPGEGYGNTMLGYGMMRAGERSGDQPVIADGVKSVGSTLNEPEEFRGVFDLLAVSTSYNFARLVIPNDPSYLSARGRWVAYLRETGAPSVGRVIKPCVFSRSCFHNHEAVEAAADLEALATELDSSRQGAKLANRAGLQAQALELAGSVAPRITGASGRSSGPGPTSGLGIFADSDTFPLTYHALSTAMLAQAVSRLGTDAPQRARVTLKRAAESSAAFMGPDGDVGYVGSRHEQAWVLAATAYTGQTAALLFADDPAAVKRFDTMSDRALDRLEKVHGFGRVGINSVPRLRFSSGSRGLDSGAVVSNGLTVYFLNLAADAAVFVKHDGTTPLTADANGFFLDPSNTQFAAVRHGDLWYAVKQHPRLPDLRFDFGLLALKRQQADGSWEDVLHPRPRTRAAYDDSAGPVILKKGKKYVPYGSKIRVKGGGVVDVKGGFRAKGGKWLRRGVKFRFQPVAGGVRMTFPVRKGDLMRMMTFLSVGARKLSSRSVTDRDSIATLSRAANKTYFKHGFASCCNGKLLAGVQQLKAHGGGKVSYTLKSR